MKLRRIQKRDGREVPFDKTKISDAVSRAQAAVGEADPHFAAEVADVVEMALLRRYPHGRLPHTPEREAVPGIEEIQDLVEQALIELGHAAVAKAYILYRDRRARIRAALEVRGQDDSLGRETAFERPEAHGDKRKAPPRVQVSGGVATWSKGRIVVALMNEAELPRATAEQVAARVEERVFDSGLKRISTALIRELVDNELVELGLSQALRRQRPVVLPRHDLRRLLSDAAPRDPAEALSADVLGREPYGGRPAREVLAGAVLARFAVEDLLPESAAELHLSGELHFEDLEAPHLALSQAIPADLLLSSDRSPQAAFELLDELAQIASRTSHGVVLEDAQLVVGLFARGTRASAAASARGNRPAPSALASFLLALSATARASGRSIDLGFAPSNASASAPSTTSAAAPNARSASAPAWLPRLALELAELAAHGERTRLPRLFLDGDDLAACVASDPNARAAFERLLTLGLVVPTWSVAGERFAAPGLARAWRERGGLVCGGACAINLVRAARRAGPWREDALLENAARSIEAALEGLAALSEHQRRERWLEGAQRGLVRGRVRYAIVPVGLREALRCVADGELRPEQAARLVSFLGEAVQRFSRSRGLPVALTTWFGERAALRFSALDREYFHVSQPLLFEGASLPAGSAATPYSTGLDLSPAGGVAAQVSSLEAAEAALSATQKSGALHPPAILRALAHGPLEDRPSVLSAWERLERTRSRLRSGAWALYALPASETESAGAAPMLYAEDEPAGPLQSDEPEFDGGGEGEDAPALESTARTASVRSSRSSSAPRASHLEDS
ncbi:MAG: ATP cone domain-containing protein [Planctomycetota bacterium]